MINELKRKAFHSLALLYVLGYLFLEHDLFLKTLLSLLILVSLIEFGRFYFPDLNLKIIGLFGNIHRAGELRGPSGIFWTLLGSLFTMAFFNNKSVVLCSMGYLILSDSVSALVGVKYGRHKLFNKSYEGSISFMCASMIIGFFFFNPAIAVAGAIFSALIELAPLPFNDNFWIPTLSASFLTLAPRFLN